MPVYFIGEQKGSCDRIKIGVAKDIQKRRSNLQTCNPSALCVLGWINTEEPYVLERRLHQKFGKNRVHGEWFEIQPGDVLPVLQKAFRDGFITKNADALQIVGYDRDAVPEYMGVWQWGDLEIDECCPFCGCLCGLAFKDVSQMYHCISCGALTDFSEFSSPDNEQED